MEDGGEPKQTATGVIAGGDAAAEGPEPDRSVYLVAPHSDWSSVSKPYSVYKLGASSSSPPPPPISSERLKRRSRTRLRCSTGGNTFASVRSPRRAWIVGVGGDAPSETVVVFDTATRTVIRGPDLDSMKSCPVVAAVGDKVYAFSRQPSWTVRSLPDFPPWFEVLDLSGAHVVKVVVVNHEGGSSDDEHYYLEGCSWKPLQIPPCLPWKLSPLQYSSLPTVVLESYVVVGSYILVSFNQRWGTYALDTDSHEWHKVDSNALPFDGCAQRLGSGPSSSIFLGCSKQKRGIEAYCISVSKASDQDRAALKLSITVLPVKYEGQELDAADPCRFVSLGDGRFCVPSFRVDTESMIMRPGRDEWFARKAIVNLRTYQIDDSSLLETAEETLQAMKPVVLFSSRVEQRFTASDVRHGFRSDQFTFLSILGSCPCVATGTNNAHQF